MMTNCFCGMVDRQKAFSLVSSQDHCQRFSPSQSSDTPRAGFKPAENPSSESTEGICAVMITTTSRCHQIFYSSEIHKMSTSNSCRLIWWLEVSYLLIVASYRWRGETPNLMLILFGIQKK